MPTEIQLIKESLAAVKRCVDSLEDSIYRLRNELDLASAVAVQLESDLNSATATSDTKESR